MFTKVSYKPVSCTGRGSLDKFRQSESVRSNFLKSSVEKTNSNIFRSYSEPTNSELANTDSTSSFRNTRTVAVRAQRSGAAGVKDLIGKITAACEKHHHDDDGSNDSNQEPPTVECNILAVWAEDDYYQFVISKYDGITTIIKAMECFSMDKDFQVTCCTALGNLCKNNRRSLTIIQASKGIHTIVDVLRKNPKSVCIHAAACNALYRMYVSDSNLFLQKQSEDDQSLQTDLLSVITESKKLFRSPASIETASKLLEILTQQK